MAKKKTPAPKRASAAPLSAEQATYLRGPIIFHGKGGNAWDEDCPAWLWREAIPAARWTRLLAEVAGRAGHDAGLATLEEATAYLMTASLEAPLGSDYTDIYVWVACQVFARHRGGAAVDVMRLIDPDAVRQTDGRFEIRDLDRYRRQLLDDLLRRIRQAVVRRAARQAKTPATQASPSCALQAPGTRDSFRGQTTSENKGSVNK